MQQHQCVPKLSKSSDSEQACLAASSLLYRHNKRSI